MLGICLSWDLSVKLAFQQLKGKCACVRYRRFKIESFCIIGCQEHSGETGLFWHPGKGWCHKHMWSLPPKCVWFNLIVLSGWKFILEMNKYRHDIILCKCKLICLYLDMTYINTIGPYDWALWRYFIRTMRKCRDRPGNDIVVYGYFWFTL